MNDLKVLDASQHTLNKPAIILRDLWKGLELSREYSKWGVESLQDFTQGIDYVGIVVNANPTNNLPIQDHAVTLEVAKHIALMSRTDKGREYRQRLIELEAKHQPPAMTKLEWIRLALVQEEQLQRLTGENKNLHIAIDNIFGYASILWVAQHVGVHESEFRWQVLKPKAIHLNLPPKKVPSPRYQYQLLYPIQAFVECYPQFDYEGIVPHNFLEEPEMK